MKRYPPPPTRYAPVVPSQPKRAGFPPPPAPRPPVFRPPKVVQRMEAMSDDDSDDKAKKAGCDAVLVYGLSQSIGGKLEGKYQNSTSEHAEMDVLSQYVDAFYDVYQWRALGALYITSPCCKVCNRILKKLGIRDKALNAKTGEVYPEKPYGHCALTYGKPKSEKLRKLIYEKIGDLYSMYKSKNISDYNSNDYWALLKDSI